MGDGLNDRLVGRVAKGRVRLVVGGAIYRATAANPCQGVAPAPPSPVRLSRRFHGSRGALNYTDINKKSQKQGWVPGGEQRITVQPLR